MPASFLILLFSFGLLLFSHVCLGVLIESDDWNSVLMSLVVALLSYVFYGVILGATGFIRRFTQTIAAIMGCGSILTIMMLVVFVMFSPFVGNNIAVAVAQLILFWSVAVKGHIIARAIERHWYLGIAISMSIFTLQYAISSALTEQA